MQKAKAPAETPLKKMKAETGLGLFPFSLETSRLSARASPFQLLSLSRDVTLDLTKHTSTKGAVRPHTSHQMSAALILHSV